MSTTDHSRPGSSSAPPAAEAPDALSLLLVEDDAGDAFLVEELLAEAGTPSRITWARTLQDAVGKLDQRIDCVLLDLGLPDAQGLSGLRRLLRRAPDTALLVLTGHVDAPLGAAAVAEGAQDYLVKQDINGSVLSRAIRYAVQRKRSDESQRRLVESELRAQENARLERGLLPVPLLDGSGLRFEARYRPGRSRALLGGDFYDAVRTDDGVVHVVIGDVCGHGPDEAALGVELRIAWRSLIFAGLTGNELLTVLGRVLEHERETEEIFATLCMLEIEPGGLRGGLYLAGHPAPVLVRPGCPAEALPLDAAGPALGLPTDERWPRRNVDLGEDWLLMLYTDGLIEGHVGPGTRRLGEEGLLEMLGRQLHLPTTDAHAPAADASVADGAMAEAEQLNGGALADDVAVLLMGRRAGA